MFRITLKKGIIPIIIGTVIFIALSTSNLNAQCRMMKGHGSHSGHDMQNKDGGDTTIIRKGIIDVESIDVNKDGFVYQDPMHWNVISDKAADCPLCGMKLEEVKIKDAIKNLKENEFNVK